MSSRLEKYRNPGLFLNELLRREALGENQSQRFLYRAVVLAVDVNGGQLQNESGAGTISSLASSGLRRQFKATVGPKNPRGSVKARVITNGLDRLMDDDETRVFWPLFPYDQISIPVSPGEHVYVLFEGNGTSHGLWIARVAGHESANSFQGKDSYKNESLNASDSFVNTEQPIADDDRASEAPPRPATSAFLDPNDV